MEYLPCPEFQAMKRRARMIEKTAIIAKGVSPELADLFLDKRDECLQRAIEKIVFETGTLDTAPPLGLFLEQ